MNQQELAKRVKDVISRWAPNTGEGFETKVMRALLCLASFEEDYKKVLDGESPIRQTYPLPLPNATEIFLDSLKKGKLQQCIHDEWVDVDPENIPVGYMVRARNFRIKNK